MTSGITSKEGHLEESSFQVPVQIHFPDHETKLKFMTERRSLVIDMKSNGRFEEGIEL